MRAPRSIGRYELVGEHGATGVGTVTGLALAVFLAYLLLGAFEGDSASYGKAPIPGMAVVELREGETDVFYFEAVEFTEATPLAPPADLGYSITAQGGESIRVDSRGGDAEEVEGGAARVVGAAFVPADGTYEVRTTSAEVSGAASPQLTFGQSPIQAVGDRFDSVVEELDGPTGVIVAVALLILFLLPRAQQAVRSRG